MISYTLGKGFYNSSDFKYQYQGYLSQIKRAGYLPLNIDNTNYKIYTPELALILLNDDIPVINEDTKAPELLNGRKYQNNYTSAYKKGLTKFNDTYSKHEIEDVELQLSYDSKKVNSGWLFVKNEFPMTFNNALIERFGYHSGLVAGYEALLEMYPTLKAFNESKKKKVDIEVKPSIVPSVIVQVYEILQPFFDEKQHAALKNVLTNFSNSKEPLVFKDNGNRLADFFKQLIENDLIIGYQKKELTTWLASNFYSIYRNEIRRFKVKTIEQTISGNQAPCKKPIVSIINKVITIK